MVCPINTTRKSSCVNTRGIPPAPSICRWWGGGGFPHPVLTQGVPQVSPSVRWGTNPRQEGGTPHPDWEGIPPVLSWERGTPPASWIGSPHGCGWTDSCENISFPILRMRAVTINFDRGRMCKQTLNVLTSHFTFLVRITISMKRPFYKRFVKRN